MSPEWITAVTAFTVAMCGLMGWFAKKLWHSARRVGHFLDDYMGQPARDGMPAKPGFMARLGSVEELTGKIAAEMTTNGGRSLRDVVQQTAGDASDIKKIGRAHV